MTASSTQQTDDNGGNNDGANDDDHPTPSEDEDAGTTAVVVLTTPKWIVCANSGDSRSVYSRSNHRAVPLSYDHKPEDEDEERRIREAGGYVSGGRVEGDLAVSRGLGDYRFKDLDAVGGQEEEEDVPMFKPSEQKVSPVPDIIVQNRDSKEDEFIIIACDGIWDVQTNQECVRMVADIFAEGEGDLGLVCEEVRRYLVYLFTLDSVCPGHCLIDFINYWAHSTCNAIFLYDIVALTPSLRREHYVFGIPGSRSVFNKRKQGQHDSRSHQIPQTSNWKWRGSNGTKRTSGSSSIIIFRRSK
ncbi:hypothetical protein ACHAXR_008267 [Thalassiosira sp. AJA248-18]